MPPPLQSKLVELGPDDPKARRLFRESLSISAHDHVLSRMLLDRFATACGPMLAIVGDWYDLDRLADYDDFPPSPEGEYVAGEYPRDRLVAFVRDYLQSVPNAIVVSENWGAERKQISRWDWPPPRYACLGDRDVYHLVTPEITDPERIEAGIVARHHWQTNVCSSCGRVPRAEITDSSILDEITRNTRHIFIPAFDGSGYLIWSPA